ncbi:hypothetical protein [Lyngbya confervoides]|uniref:DUF3122 domain-containing protein n=1 Tax=Lyngbya confervoides BDU141951 TaxID=1574623 RepID=A0ABD4SYR5_9CYAN|nr:hypothetical protein [Lyngbya confervoides]MCM1981602.1 hypothetical protein [Lyngbya confervoides BDU141951]
MKRSRLGLSLLTVGCFAATVRVLTFPAPALLHSSALLPDALRLASWSRQGGAPLPRVEAKENYDVVIQGRQYHFQRGSTQLTLQVRYLINTDANLAALSRKLELDEGDRLGSQPLEQVQHHPQLGWYRRVLQTPEKIVLDTCLNPQGPNTVTPQQFLNNRLVHDLNLPQIGRWLIGTHQALDKRCLWSRLLVRSTSPDGASLPAPDQLIPLWETLNAQIHEVFNHPLQPFNLSQEPFN